MYSPKIPIKNNCTEEKRNNPIMIAAIPMGKRFQNRSFKIKVTRPTRKLSRDRANPIIVANLSGKLE
jgi:hypothetical protein